MRKQDTRVRPDASRRRRLARADAIRCACFRHAAATTNLYSVDYIDLFLIHDPFSGTERRLETYRALLDAQAAGKIRTVGVSN